MTERRAATAAGHPATSSSEALEQLALRPDVKEERFDRLTRLAQRLFRVDVVIVALFDDERSWLKSAQGMDAAYVAREEGDEEFVHAPEPLVVENLALDPRYRDHPNVNGEYASVRFVASVPLDVGGLRVGALCLVDGEPHEFGEHRLSQLREIATMVERAFGVPAVLENDASAGALGEFRYGTGRGTDTMLYLTVSTGVGGGSVIGGRLHRGAAGNGGEQHRQQGGAWRRR